MNKLSSGQEVRFLPTGQIGIIEAVFNDGQQGLFRSGAQTFTVGPWECDTPDEPADQLDQLFEMHFDNCAPATIFKKG